jgi:putative spermidine/putrescine transport system ATP-binding protein/spermidine/putrescine transport system ATP-binding protein
MAEVLVSNVSRNFGPMKALDDVSIGFADGGFYALLGPSGSGKTTLLRLIAGFDFPDSGRIVIGGEGVERVPVEKRRIGMVFQNYALFPNMSVADNVAFGLSVRGEARATIAAEVQRALDLVQLGKLGGRRPHQLSGGQRQRVALARAIVTKPRVLLLDEPLSALDKALRVDMQVELKRIQREIGITTVFVTHDQEEALTMADRIGILRDGRLVQEGPPEEIYDRPRSEFAATFLGDANILRGDATQGGIRLADGTAIAVNAGTQARAGGKAACAVRPERIRIAAAGPGAAAAGNELRGRVSKRMFAGNSSTYFVDRDGETIKVLVKNDGSEKLAEGQDVVLRWSRESTVLLG